MDCAEFLEDIRSIRTEEDARACYQRHTEWLMRVPAHNKNHQLVLDAAVANFRWALAEDLPAKTKALIEQILPVASWEKERDLTPFQRELAAHRQREAEAAAEEARKAAERDAAKNLAQKLLSKRKRA